MDTYNIGRGLLSCLLLFPLFAVSQTTLKKGTTDPIYLQLYGGINKSANEHLPWTEISKYPFSGGFFVGVGKEFSPLWG